MCLAWSIENNTLILNCKIDKIISAVSIYNPQKEKELEDTKGVIIIRIYRRTDNTMAKRKSTKGQTTI
jgi:hypothetical protein